MTVLGATVVGFPAVGTTMGTVVVGAGDGTETVGAVVGTAVWTGAASPPPTVRVPGVTVTGYISPFRPWTPIVGSATIVMPVVPVAVPRTVRVARVIRVPPRGTICDRSTLCMVTWLAGSCDTDFREAHSGKATEAIVATEGLVRLTETR
jgi:hypothetical protein